MRHRLLVLLVVLVAVAAVGDLLARSYAESNVERAVRERATGVGRVVANIDSFPFVGRLLLFSEVPHLDLRLRELTVDGADAVEELRVDIDGLRLDRGVLLNDRRVRITDVDRVRITAVVDLDRIVEVAAAVGIEVRFDDDRATFSTAGLDVEADVAVEEGFVVLTAAALPPVRLPMPGASLLPCVPSAEVDDNRLVVTCESDRLPDLVVDAIGSVDLRG